MCACVFATERDRDLTHRCTRVKTASSMGWRVFAVLDLCLRHMRCNLLTVCECCHYITANTYTQNRQRQAVPYRDLSHILALVRFGWTYTLEIKSRCQCPDFLFSESTTLHTTWQMIQILHLLRNLPAFDCVIYVIVNK